MKLAKLGDICTLNYGRSLRGYSPEPDSHLPVRVFGTNGPIGWSREALTDEPTIIIGRKGAYRGVHYSEFPSWTIDTAYYLELGVSNVDLKWLYYRLMLLDINSMDSGSAIPSTKREDFYSSRVQVPEINIQRRVVNALSSYDDLIENNQRRTQLLEESARLLYKEWFVHLCFPGHEHVKVINGVPEGWSRRRLVDVTSKIGSGATPKGGASAYQSEGIALIRSQNVYDYRFDSSGLAFINDEQADRLSNVEVNGSDVLLNITGASVGRCCLAPDYHLPARINQHVMIIRSDSEKCGPHYLLHFINSYREKQRILAAAGAGGSTREALTKSFVQNLEVTLPSRTLMEQFEEFAKDCFEQKQKLEMQNIRLAKARDLLLPKLMSGELAA